MALTVASDTLDTDWQEFSTIDFTAGSLTTVSACIDEVGVKIKRGALTTTTTPSSTSVGGWLSRAKQELAEVKKFTWRRRYVTGNTVKAQYRYSLPPDYGGGYVSVKDMTNDRKLRIIGNHVYDMYYPDMSEENNDEPKFATIKNRELWIGPPPSGVYVLELEYERTGDDITLTDFSWLPEMERWRCVDFATAEAFRSIHQWKEADIYDQRWEKGLSKAIRADSKNKFAQMGYRALDFWHG